MTKAKKTTESEQSRRFINSAREAGVELDEEQLKRALRQMKERPEKGEDGKGS